MSVWIRNSLIVLALMVAIAFLFREQINRFLFHPEGLSTAASELCVSNRAGLRLVVQVNVSGGANSTTLLDDGGEACSPAPEDGLPVELRFSIQDGQGPYCTLETVTGAPQVLTLFDAPDGCEWGEE